MECIKDVYQDITEEWNRTFVMYPERGASYPGKDDNPLSTTGQVVIGIGQVMMDVFIVLTGIIWYLFVLCRMVKVKNLRLFGAVAPYFLIRALVYLVTHILRRMLSNFLFQRISYGMILVSLPLRFHMTIPEISSIQVIQVPSLLFSSNSSL